jgi:cell division protein FtsN
MLRTSEAESEILLGNKQLLGIFFIVALLLGIAFAGGYVLGNGSKRSSTSIAVPSSNQESTNFPEHTVRPSAAPGRNATADPPETQSETPPQKRPAADTSTNDPDVLGPKHRPVEIKSPKNASAADSSVVDFTPQTGQTFLQVAAEGKDEAIAIADVLHKQGFRAHAVPKPGNLKIYRILIGPIRDSSDLSSTRDSLRHTGFREVIVQRY